MAPSGLKIDDSISIAYLKHNLTLDLASANKNSLSKHQKVMEEKQAVVAWNASKQGTAVLLSPEAEQTGVNISSHHWRQKLIC